MDALLKDPRAGTFLRPHSFWRDTALLALYEAARTKGVLPTAEFIWLRPVNRQLWYLLNNLGRRTAWPETAGLWAHYMTETAIARVDPSSRGIEDPQVEEAVSASGEPCTRKAGSQRIRYPPRIQARRTAASGGGSLHALPRPQRLLRRRPYPGTQQGGGDPGHTPRFLPFLRRSSRAGRLRGSRLRCHGPHGFRARVSLSRPPASRPALSLPQGGRVPRYPAHARPAVLEGERLRRHDATGILPPGQGHVLYRQ